jgi:hypothetical protein
VVYVRDGKPESHQSDRKPLSFSVTQTLCAGKLSRARLTAFISPVSPFRTTNEHAAVFDNFAHQPFQAQSDVMLSIFHDGFRLRAHTMLQRSRLAQMRFHYAAVDIEVFTRYALGVEVFDDEPAPGFGAGASLVEVVDRPVNGGVKGFDIGRRN